MKSNEIGMFEGYLLKCEQTFNQKLSLYGASWVGFSPQGFIDQIYIKAHRYKTISQLSERKIPDPPELELYALINYSIIFIFYLDTDFMDKLYVPLRNAFGVLPKETKLCITARYRDEVKKTIQLHLEKDHDYGAAWKDLSIEGIADLIFAKTLRLKTMVNVKDEIHDKDDPDGIIATLRDICNYSLFALFLRDLKS